MLQVIGSSFVSHRAEWPLKGFGNCTDGQQACQLRKSGYGWTFCVHQLSIRFPCFFISPTMYFNVFFFGQDSPPQGLNHLLQQQSTWVWLCRSVIHQSKCEQTWNRLSLSSQTLWPKPTLNAALIVNNNSFGPLATEQLHNKLTNTDLRHIMVL